MIAKAKPNPFATETELCARFLEAVGEKWTAYPETAGWDILLVRGADGLQIGIEAKLKLNAKVLNQALEDHWAYLSDRPGPDCRAVLVPDREGGDLGKIAAHLGITVLRLRLQDWSDRKVTFHPDLPSESQRLSGYEEWHECCPLRRHPLPEYVPDVSAGAPAPIQLTAWKIAALKIAVTVERRGYVTRADFKHHRIDHRRWLVPHYGWLRARDGVYVAGPKLGDFKTQHPRVYAEIAADADQWLPAVPVPLLVPQQLSAVP